MSRLGNIRSPFLRLSLVTVIVGLVAVYTLEELRHAWDVATGPQPTRRVVRDLDQVTLPRLYLCPADRSTRAPLRWHSYECGLRYQDEALGCTARLRHYRGDTPDTFRDGGKGRGGECLEFSTNDTGIRKEWSAAWNEIILRASFDAWKGSLSQSLDEADILREVEIGYLPEEWTGTSRAGSPSTDVDRYYYPLLRVPFFLFSPGGREGAGVATRTFISEEVDQGRSLTGRYWYTYGNTQISVEDPSVPKYALYDQVSLEHHSSDPLGVVHIIITIEDFAQFEFEVESSFYPLLAGVGHIAGAWALMACVLRGFLDPSRRRRDELFPKDSQSGVPECYDDEDEDKEEGPAPRGGMYAQIPTDEDAIAAQALMG